MTDEELAEALHSMLRIRMFEERVRTEFAKGDMPGFVHSYAGSEGIAVGVIGTLRSSDLVTSTHRGHGHCLAKGASLIGIVAELYGREKGICHGRGGSMHIADFTVGMLGANAIVGGGVSLAVGGALAAEVLADGRVSVAFFGDGAANEGVIHESMNLASIWHLPVIFVCENNGWAESTPFSYSSSTSALASRGIGYSIPSVTIDGADVRMVRAAAIRAVKRAREGQGPSFLECVVPRREGHYVGDPEGYRGDQHRMEGLERDPIHVARGALGPRLANSKFDAWVAEWTHSLDQAYEYARASAWPAGSDVERYVVAN